MKKNKIQIVFKTAFNAQVVRRSLLIALYVGFILNFINQGEALTVFDLQAVNWTKFLLTFLVPYAVSTSTAISMELENLK